MTDRTSNMFLVDQIRIAQELSQVRDDIIHMFPYGSRVYGTHSYDSDYDFIIVYGGEDKSKDAQQYDSHSKDLSVTTYHIDSWKEHLANHKIFAMECQSYGYTEPSKIDLPLLRKEISSKASNSWVKCKKKLELHDEYYIGIKSLFHSFRIPMFGIQLAKHGRIINFAEANHMWFNEFEPMLHSRPMWEEIKAEYQPRHNALMTEFRKYAEKK